MKKLKERRENLKKKLEAGFNIETARSLALCENSIACTRNRIAGHFKDDRSVKELKVNRETVNFYNT